VTTTPTNEAALEALATAQDAHFRSEGTATEARMESRLYGAAVGAGMDREHDDLHGWVAETVVAWLLSGPTEWDVDDEAEEGIGTDEYGRFEYVS